MSTVQGIAQRLKDVHDVASLVILEKIVLERLFQFFAKNVIQESIPQNIARRFGDLIL